MKMVLGVDIGGTDVKYGLFSIEGRFIDKWSAKTNLSDGGAQIIPSIAENIHNYFREKQLDESDLEGIGMGIPGPVDEKGYVAKCVNLYWYHFYPAKELQKYFPNVYIEAGNDANVAALGEFYQGAGEKYHSMMMITLGTGVGGGIILNGKILTGAHGNAGEIGHIAVGPEEIERCNCGGRGCVDQFASATGIVRVMRKLLKVQNAAITAKEICEMAKAQDPIALECLHICFGVLGKAMAFFSHAFEPEAYVIGGGVSGAADVIIPIIREHYEEHLHLIEEGADISPASLGNDAGIIGAAMLVSHRRQT